MGNTDHVVRMIDRLAIRILRARGITDARRLERGIYHSRQLRGLGCSVGPIVVLSTAFVTTGTPDELRAVIVHELAHWRLHHQLKQLWCRIIAPWKLPYMRRQHEYAADAFVRRAGLSVALASALARPDVLQHGTDSHPSVSARIDRLFA
jgi:Zn-dependent protease with chaperone function